ncbi:MAG: hypothetical protein J7K48_05030, partial [Thermococcus sp.]|nr:hypothetical protein [Thermococcus sp.]
SYGGEYGDIANAVVVAPNGDLIIAGGTDSFGAGSSDVWVLRLDSGGNVKWQKTFGGSGSDWAYAVSIAPEGGVTVAGWTMSFGAGRGDAWILRLPVGGSGFSWFKSSFGFSSKDSNARVRDSNAQVETSSALESVPNTEVRNSKAEVLSEGITVKTQYPSDERILTILVLSFGVVAGATLYRARKRKGSSQG